MKTLPVVLNGLTDSFWEVFSIKGVVGRGQSHCHLCSTNHSWSVKASYFSEEVPSFNSSGFSDERAIDGMI